MDGFEIITKLGEGAYSTVYKVLRREDKTLYALKKVKLLSLSSKEKMNSLNEVRILASVKSNFVVPYKEAFFENQSNSLCIIMEYADNGDLFRKITEHRENKTYFEETEIWRIAIQIIKGLKALHDMKILHRDLKSANVFLYKDGSAKLGDLNVSKVIKQGMNYTQTGTPYYASPEVWSEQAYNEKSDIWSLGCVIYEMICLKPPFRAENMEKLYNKVKKGIFPPIPKCFSEDLNLLLKLLIQVDPNKRPTCGALLKTSIITKRIEFFKNAYGDDDVNEDIALIKTITFPKNISSLTEQLPQPTYAKKIKIVSKTEFNTQVVSERGNLTNMTENNNVNNKRGLSLQQGKMELPKIIKNNNVEGDKIKKKIRIMRIPLNIDNSNVKKEDKKVNRYLNLPVIRNSEENVRLPVINRVNLNIQARNYYSNNNPLKIMNNYDRSQRENRYMPRYRNIIQRREDKSIKKLLELYKKY